MLRCRRDARVPLLASAVVLAAALGACGIGTSGQLVAPPAPAARIPSTASAADALAAAVEQVQGEQITDFRAELKLNSTTLLRVDGTDHAAAGWEARTTMNDLVEGQNYIIHARSTPTRSWMQMEGWKGDSAGCWLALGPRDVPVGIGGLTRGEPAYLGALSALRADRFVDAEVGGIAASLPLDGVLQLVSAKIMRAFDVGAVRLADHDVPVTVTLRHGRVSEIEIAGGDVVTALEAAEVEWPQGARRFLEHVAFTMGYAKGDDRFAVRVPADDLVMTGDGSGCR